MTDDLVKRADGFRLGTNPTDYDVGLANALINAMSARLEALQAENARLDAEAQAQAQEVDLTRRRSDKWQSMVLDCEEYLKEGETPAERIDREIKDCLSMMKMLEKEKRKSEALQAERCVEVRPLEFVWTKDEHSPNPTTYRTAGDGFSAYVLIPYEGDNNPEGGTGTWNGVAQHRGEDGFASKDEAIAYCEKTIRDFAQVSLNRASNFITTRPASEVRAETHAAAIEAAVGAALRAISVKGSGYRDENERLLARAEKEMKLELAKNLRALHTDASLAAIERIKREAREEALAMANADTLALEIAKRLSATDPDVEPWGVRWAELLGDTLTVDGGTKTKAHAITALIEKGDG